MIKQYLNHEVNKKILERRVSEYLITDPYPYAIIPNFLEDSFFEKIRKQCDNLVSDLMPIEDFDIFHTYLNIPELLSVCCHTDFMNLVGNIFNLRVKRKRDQYPSLRVLPEGGNGLHIHNDRLYIGNITVFLYLSHWEEGFGGEIGLYRKKDGIFIKTTEIAPRKNCLFMMPITGTTMYHCINPTFAGYLRKCAYIPISII